MNQKDLILQLNTVLKYKLTAINQLFLHARMFKYNGNVHLADFEYKVSIDTMKHADMLVEYILSQNEVPNMQEMTELNVGDDTQHMLQYDLKLCEAMVSQLEKALSMAEACKEKALLGLLPHILENQKEQIAFIREQINTTVEDCA